MAEDSVAQDQLRAFIERIERMEEEKAAIAADIREIYAEAKGNGFDTKVLRQVVKIRKQDHSERMEQEALLELGEDPRSQEIGSAYSSPVAEVRLRKQARRGAVWGRPATERGVEVQRGVGASSGSLVLLVYSDD